MLAKDRQFEESLSPPSNTGTRAGKDVFARGRMLHCTCRPGVAVCPIIPGSVSREANTRVRYQVGTASRTETCSHPQLALSRGNRHGRSLPWPATDAS